MTTQVHNIGEEFMTKVLAGDLSLPSTVDVLLFHDGEVSGDTTNGDDLGPDDDLGDITTEPDGASFARETASLDGDASWDLAQVGGDYEMELQATLSYDLSDSDNPDTLDAYGVVVEFEADGDGSPQDHLWWTDTLDDDYAVQGDFDLDDPSLAISGQTDPSA